MKWRPADLTMLDANASYFMKHFYVCYLNCFSLQFCETGGNGVVNVWLCLNTLLYSLIIFQKEGNNRAVIQSPMSKIQKLGFIRMNFTVMTAEGSVDLWQILWLSASEKKKSFGECPNEPLFCLLFAMNMLHESCVSHTCHSHLFIHTFTHLQMGIEHLLIACYCANV